MQAIVQHQYGPPAEVLHLTEIDPPAMQPDEVLVRVQVSTVAGADWHLLRGLPYVARLATGLLRPNHEIPGYDIAGVVESIGAEVTAYQPGDAVFGTCDGAYAELVAVTPDQIALKPESLNFDQAAAIPVSGLAALRGLRDAGDIQSGQQVLINGASGGVGTLAVQIAKAFGTEVTGVCSTRNVALVESLGADHVIDYTQTDFTHEAQRYDLILDMAANKAPGAFRRALKEHGTLVMVGGGGDRVLMGTKRWIQAMFLDPFVPQHFRPLLQEDHPEDLEKLRSFVDSGQLSPVITARYPLAEVPEALGHFERHHSTGKIVITIGDADPGEAFPPNRAATPR